MSTLIKGLQKRRKQRDFFAAAGHVESEVLQGSVVSLRVFDFELVGASVLNKQAEASIQRNVSRVKSVSKHF